MDEQKDTIVQQQPKHKCTVCSTLMLIAGYHPRHEKREGKSDEIYLAVQCHNCNTKMVPELISAP